MNFLNQYTNGLDHNKILFKTGQNQLLRWWPVDIEKLCMIKQAPLTKTVNTFTKSLHIAPSKPLKSALNVCCDIIDEQKLYVGNPQLY